MEDHNSARRSKLIASYVSTLKIICLWAQTRHAPSLRRERVRIANISADRGDPSLHSGWKTIRTAEDVDGCATRVNQMDTHQHCRIGAAMGLGPFEYFRALRHLSLLGGFRLLNDLAVKEMDGTLSMLGKTGVVGNHTDGGAFTVQLLQQVHYGFAIA